MIPLYTDKEFDLAKSQTRLPCKCLVCDSTFFTTKDLIKRSLKPNPRHKNNYCSRVCQQKSRISDDTFNTTSCATCGIEVTKKVSASKRHKNTFCSHSCSTKHFNKNKTHGTRRSKLEVWLEERLTILYPNLPIDFNKKDAVGSELDIHIPSLNLAIEINGIFHYEPIYGIDKLGKIQENDISKSKACHDAKIDLCVIDASGQKYFKVSSSKKYLDIINQIIKERLLIV